MCDPVQNRINKHVNDPTHEEIQFCLYSRLIIELVDPEAWRPVYNARYEIPEFKEN